MILVRWKLRFQNSLPQYSQSKYLFYGVLRLTSYASTVYNATLEYVHLIDDKLSTYSSLINLKVNCLSCAEDILQYISELKLSLAEYVGNNQISEEIEHILQIMKVKEEQILSLYNESAAILKDQTSLLQKWPLFVMLFGAVFCLGCSALFHLFIAHSEKVSNLLNRLDYAGISILIVCSCYPLNFYLFNCDMCKILFIYIK